MRLRLMESKLNEVYDIFAELEEAVENGKKVEQYQYIGLRK